MLRVCLIAVFLMPLAGCGISTEAKFEVLMRGIYEAPTDATGDQAPDYLDITLVSVTGLTEEGTSFQPDTEWTSEEFRVIDRSQLVYTTNLADYVGQTWTSLTFEFEADIAGQNKNTDELTATLATTTYAYETPITIQQAKDVTLEIQVLWDKTIGEGSLTAPTLQIVKP